MIEKTKLKLSRRKETNLAALYELEPKLYVGILTFWKTGRVSWSIFAQFHDSSNVWLFAEIGQA